MGSVCGDRHCCSGIGSHPIILGTSLVATRRSTRTTISYPAHQPAHSPQRLEHCAAPFTNPRGLRVQCSYLLCRYEKAQGVNLGLEFFVSTIKAMATISDLHEIYAFQSSFARLLSKFVAFCCERDRVTCNKAPLSRRRKMQRISTQRSVKVSDQFFGVTPTSSASAWYS